MTERVSVDRLPPTIDLLTAAQLLGIGRAAAYRLVRDGCWPTPVIKVGRLFRVRTALLLTASGWPPCRGPRPRSDLQILRMSLDAVWCPLVSRTPHGQTIKA